MPIQLYKVRGAQLDVYVQQEARKYVDERALREKKTRSVIVNTILMEMRARDLKNSAKNIGITDVNKTIGSQSDENTNQSPQTIKEGVKNE